MITTGLKWDVGPGSCEFPFLSLYPMAFIEYAGASVFPSRACDTGLKIIDDVSILLELDAYPTSVATAVSTSNHLANEIIEVETDVPVVWTVEVRDGVE